MEASTQGLPSWRSVLNSEGRQESKAISIPKLGIVCCLDCCLSLFISPAATLPQGLSSPPNATAPPPSDSSRRIAGPQCSGHLEEDLGKESVSWLLNI